MPGGLPPPDPAPDSWGRRLARRFRAHCWLKGIGTTVFMSLFFAGYFHLLRHPIYPVTVMPLVGLDRLVGFQPAALLPYVSLWLYVSLPPALLASRRELIAYGWAVGGLCLLGMACFLFWPTAVPPSGVDWDAHAGFSLVKGLDAGGNACPSLHVATAVFSALWLDRLLRELDSGPRILAGNWLWCAAIVYSTLATKQHVALDVAGGLALGLAAAVVALGRRSRAAAEAAP